MTPSKTFLFPAAIFLTLAQAAIADTDKNFENQASLYSDKIEALASKWPPKRLASMKQDAASPLSLVCVETPDEPLYIGIEQIAWIAAPLKTVAGIIDDIDSYEKIFTDYKDVRVLKRENSVWTTHWEQKIPLFFVPNIKYEMTYFVSEPVPARKIYRYKLRSGGNLKFSDGIIVIESSGKNLTKYVGYDFFDAYWGIARVLGTDNIWEESVEGFAQTDLAIKLKAENPSQPDSWVVKESKKMVEEKVKFDCSKKIPAEAVFENK